MKGVKGKLIKKLKSIKPAGYLKPDRVLQVFAMDGFIDSFPKIPDPRKDANFTPQDPDPELISGKSGRIQEPEVIDVTELMRDLEEDDESMSSDDGIDDKENIRPNFKENGADWDKENRNFQAKLEPERGSRRASRCSVSAPLSEIDISSFRRPDLNSCSLFDPNLLAAFELAVKEHRKLSEAERKARIELETLEIEPPNKIPKIEIPETLEIEPLNKIPKIEIPETLEIDPISQFEERCPPGGDGAVILYSTSLTGIRKTFEDCNKVRFLLESFRVLFFERDVSMHSEYREELWNVLEGKQIPPRLFVKGRYIGGAEEVLTLHEQGRLKVLFEGIPGDRNGPCEGCAGVRFVLCFKCCGSRRIVAGDGSSGQCSVCNENGLIVCPYCG